jgi:hypothetical protein
MCGIAGLYTKTDTLRSQLGFHLAAMLGQLSDRGPDSAGVAFYRDPAPDGWCKISVYSPAAEPDWADLADALAVRFGDASLSATRATHAVFIVAAAAEDVQAWLRATRPELTPRAPGRRSRSSRRRGCPPSSCARPRLDRGRHALGHTCMATESR